MIESEICKVEAEKLLFLLISCSHSLEMAASNSLAELIISEEWGAEGEKVDGTSD